MNETRHEQRGRNMHTDSTLRKLGTPQLGSHLHISSATTLWPYIQGQQHYNITTLQHYTGQHSVPTMLYQNQQTSPLIVA